VSVVAVGLATSALTACSSDESDSSDGSASQQAVAVKLFQFDPETVEIASGTEVLWTNGDETVHQPTSGAPGAITPIFDVSLDGVDASGSHTFDEPGSYPYFCQLHTSMTGTVVVR